MAPAFGFSVGDFVAVATMIWKISQALSGVSEDSKLYQELQLELSAFQGAFVQLQQALVNGATLPPDQVTRAKDVLAQIQRLTNDFNNHIEKFKDISTSGENSRGKKYVVLRKRVSWTLYGKRPVQQFREAIRGYTAVLVLIMHTLNSQAMQGLHQEIQTGTQHLKLHMDNTLQEPWDQRPIRFQDAIGRRYPVPLEICGTFEVTLESSIIPGFLGFLQHAFRNNPISDAVQKRSIWLFSPVVAETKTWVLITAEDWQSSLYPGMQLGMSVSDGRRGLISDAHSDIPGETEVRLQTPLPLWASAAFPEDAKFKLQAPRHRKPLRSKGSYHIHDKYSEPGHMKGNTSRQVPSVSYPCPNVARCEKQFKSQEERFEHLKPTLFDLESFRLFTRPDPQFENCLFCARVEIKSSREIFEKGIELQKSLTGSSSGLAPCVAEMVAASDLDVQHLCMSCFCMNGGLIRFGHLPITQTTPLHAAAMNGMIHVVEMILENGGDMNLQCSESGTPLYAAARAGRKSIVKLLLERGGIVKRDNRDTSLFIAAARGHENIVRILLDHGASVNAEGDIYCCQQTALQAASRDGHFEVVQLLLDKGANVNAQGGPYGSALKAALDSGRQEIAQLLLDRGAWPVARDGEAGRNCS